eukprot:TRINITY_DN29284_c0_g1_i1.p2 TRINITY_DN29284_c0_g1~~TRINITY_DN29284_c0_g1_i1.p2  ORF type:complete len:141 (-),score=28.90 TRINITY_DN29284_c0_g1_i1:116-538(-)
MFSSSSSSLIVMTSARGRFDPTTLFRKDNGSLPSTLEEECIFDDDVEAACRHHLVRSSDSSGTARRRSPGASIPLLRGVVVVVVDSRLITEYIMRAKDACPSDTSLNNIIPVSYTHLRAHETPEHLVCRLLLEKKKKKQV